MDIVGIGGEVTHIAHIGPWALLHWAGEANQLTVSDQSKVLLEFDVPQGQFRMLITAEGGAKPTR